MKKYHILDVCCGPRMMWFDKACPAALYGDKRQEKFVWEIRTGDTHRKWEISPDVLYDFTALPFTDDAFSLVVFDPPHLKSFTETSYMAQKYGALFLGWQEMLREGFTECFRVLKLHGTLIFKWSEAEIPVSRVLGLCEHQPLFGHKSGKQSKTHWLTFFKQ